MSNNENEDEEQQKFCCCLDYMDNMWQEYKDHSGKVSLFLSIGGAISSILVGKLILAGSIALSITNAATFFSGIAYEKLKAENNNLHEDNKNLNDCNKSLMSEKKDIMRRFTAFKEIKTPNDSLETPNNSLEGLKSLENPNLTDDFELETSSNKTLKFDDLYNRAKNNLNINCGTSEPTNTG